MSDERVEKAIEAAAAAARAAFMGHDSPREAEARVGAMGAGEREDWTRAITAALRVIAASGTVLGVRPMAPAPCPPGWASVSRSHWQNGDEAAIYQSPEALRDWMANSALTGLLAAARYGAEAEHHEQIARLAYGLADAMLAARLPRFVPHAERESRGPT